MYYELHSTLNIQWAYITPHGCKYQRSYTPRNSSPKLLLTIPARIPYWFVAWVLRTIFSRFLFSACTQDPRDEICGLQVTLFGLRPRGRLDPNRQRCSASSRVHTSGGILWSQITIPLLASPAGDHRKPTRDLMSRKRQAA